MFAAKYIIYIQFQVYRVIFSMLTN